MTCFYYGFPNCCDFKRNEDTGPTHGGHMTHRWPTYGGQARRMVRALYNREYGRHMKHTRRRKGGTHDRLRLYKAGHQADTWQRQGRHMADKVGDAPAELETRTESRRTQWQGGRWPIHGGQAPGRGQNTFSCKTNQLRKYNVCKGTTHGDKDRWRISK